MAPVLGPYRPLAASEPRGTVLAMLPAAFAVPPARLVARRVVPLVLVANLVSCRALFGLEEPVATVDDSLANCAGTSGDALGSSDEPDWMPIAGFAIFPDPTDPAQRATHRERNSQLVQHATVVDSVLVYGNTESLVGLPIQSLLYGPGGTYGVSSTPIIAPTNQARETGLAIQGVVRWEWTSTSTAEVATPEPALAVLLCRWQAGCSVEYISRAGLVGHVGRSAAPPDAGPPRNEAGPPDSGAPNDGAPPPPPSNGTPCTDESARSELAGAMGYGCFRFAAPVAGRGMLFGAGGQGDSVTLCTTQGGGGMEDNATSVACLSGPGQADGGRVGEAGDFPKAEVKLSNTNQPPVAIAVDPDPPPVSEPTGPRGPSRVPMRIVTDTTVYFANISATGTASQALVDGLPRLPARTITAHSLQPDVTWLALRWNDDGGTRSEVWTVRLLRQDGSAELVPVGRPMFWRKGKIVGLAHNSDTNQLYWVEESEEGGKVNRVLYQTPVSSIGQQKGSCARALREPGIDGGLAHGLNHAHEEVRIIVPTGRSSMGCNAHDELFVLAARNLWGRPGARHPNCDAGVD